MDLFIVADRYHKSTAVRHINHLSRILPKILGDRKTLILLADNGPDWSTEVQANLLNFARLFRDCGLDRLIIIHYSPNYSKFNFIERRWGNITHCFLVTFAIYIYASFVQVCTLQLQFSLYMFLRLMQIRFRPI